MKIAAFKAVNFKGLRSVSIESPDPSLVVISGRNGQGKTCVLDAIQAALGGKTAGPEVPVRRGAERAEVTLNLVDFKVSRRWSVDGKSSTLTVERADGSRPSSPQALLDSFYSRVTFDPLAFIFQDSKSQADTLRKLAGLDEEFARLAAEEEKIRNKRTEQGRKLRDLEGEIKGLPTEDALKDVPDAELSAAGLMAEHEAALNELNQNNRLRDSLRSLKTTHAKALEEITQREKRVVELRRQLAQAEAELEGSKTSLIDLEEDLAITEDNVSGLEDPDVESIRRRMGSVEATNQKVRQKAMKRQKQAQWEALRDEVAQCTSDLDSIAAERTALLSEARYPIEGLDVRGDEVLLAGVPISQVSMSMKIQLGLAVGAALKPGLRIALIRDGSLLDDHTFATLRAWLKEHDFQAWIERVASKEEAQGVVIEEGQVYANRPLEAEPAPPATPSQSFYEQGLKDAEGVF